MSNVSSLLLVAFAITSVIGGTFSQKLPIGGAIRIYSDYESLGKNMRFVPEGGSEGSFFSEPVVKIFKNPSIKRKYEQPQGDIVFAGDFGMEFCSNLDRLFEAYFGGFRVEKLKKSWRIFTKDWSNYEIAEHFGVAQSHLDDNIYSYVLVRIQRIHDGQRIVGSAKNLEREETVARTVDNIAVDDSFTGLANVTQFISNVGSHYIHSYTTGNSLYQVLVYRKFFFDWLKNLSRQQRLPDISKAQQVAFDSAYYNFEHSGTIKTASGNRSVETWAVVNIPYEKGNRYNDLLNAVSNNKTKLRRLNELLQDEVILQLELRSVAPLFREPQRRDQFLKNIKKYFENVLVHTS